jgi:ferritin-like protein
LVVAGNDPDGETSRRRLLQSSGAAAVGGVLVLAGCGSSHTSLRKLPRPVLNADIAILNRLLDLEYLGIAAYTAGTPLLAGSMQKAAKHFLDQELTHAGEMEGLVRQAAHDVVTLLHEIERQQIAAYIAALSKLTPGSVRAAVCSVLSNDAQHISVLRGLLGRAPVPAAFVTGEE